MVLATPIAQVVAGALVKIVGTVTRLVPFTVEDSTGRAVLDLDARVRARRQPVRLGSRVEVLGTATHRDDDCSCIALAGTAHAPMAITDVAEPA
jgi:hypothetical protein